MSKDNKKTEYTPVDNVAANNVADVTAAADVAAEAKSAKRRLPLSKGAIIGLSAAGVAVILGAGFTGAAIAAGIDHGGHRGGDHSQFEGGRQGQNGQKGHQGLNGQQLPGQPGQLGQNGQQLPGQPGQPGQGGQFVDPDPNDNDGPGTGIAPKGAPQGGTGVAPQGTAPVAPPA
jgi:hypothetical protein